MGFGRGVVSTLRDYFTKGHQRTSKVRYRTLKDENKALLAEDIRERRYTLRAYPSFVGLGTDLRCNLKCIMCIQRLEDRKTLLEFPAIGERDLIQFAKEVFPTAETLQLNTGGEPLMSRNVDLEIDLAEEYCVHLDVITNGLLLNSKQGRLQKLCRNSRSISFSLDSPVQRTYESIRIGSDFKRVVENMGLLQKYRHEMSPSERPFFGINMVVMRRNLGEVLPMVRFARDIGADHLGLARVYVHSNDMADEALEPLQQKFNQVLLEATELAATLGIQITVPPPHQCDSRLGPRQERDAIPTQPERGSKWCPFLWKRTYLDNLANVFVCCEPSHPIAGNIREKSFQDIWNGENYVRMRQTFTGGPAYRQCDECAEGGYLSNINPF